MTHGLFPATMLTIIGLFAFGIALAKPTPLTKNAFSRSAADITRTCKKVLSETRVQLDQIVEFQGKRTFQNTIVAMDRARGQMIEKLMIPQFLGSVSPDEQVREAAKKCELDRRTFDIEMTSRRDLYEVFRQVAQSKTLTAHLDSEDRRFMEEMALEFAQNGLGLSEKKQAHLVRIRKELAELVVSFQKRQQEDSDSLPFTQAQLQGLPKDFLQGLEKTADAKFLVTTAYPHFFPVMRNARDENTRRKLWLAFQNLGGKENSRILLRTLALRDEAAQLLGNKNHAEFKMASRMAQNPQNVRAFLKELKDRFRKKRQSDLRLFRRLKANKTHPKEKELRLQPWDRRYLENRNQELNHRVDAQALKEYFPLQTVLSGMLEVFAELFDLKITEISPAQAWHPDVRQFLVKDAKTKKKLGDFYLDLFPREGKYKHMAEFELGWRVQQSNGSITPAAAAMVCNFSKPTPTAPSLLTHDEVTTLFHEFGHVLHALLGSSKYRRFSGTNVPWDFVEVPSILLENWAWNAEVLNRISGHTKDPQKKLPKILVSDLLASRRINVGSHYSYQLFLASFDLEAHTRFGQGFDPTKEWKALFEDITGFSFPSGVDSARRFGHIMGSYDAGYYSYLWAETLATDVFLQMTKNGVLNPNEGRRFRQQILEAGGTQDPFVLLEHFLGRKPNKKAFYFELGL